MSYMPVQTSVASWRTPTIIVSGACLIALLSFGPRSAMGQFLTPLSFDHGWGRDVFSFSLAIQNLVWGAAQPFAGAVADRFGAVRVMWAGALFYSLGLGLMAYAPTTSTLHLSAGVLVGFGLAGTAFPMIVGALGKLVPENFRSTAFGAATAAGSFGQFLFSPFAQALIKTYDWQTALLTFSVLMLAVLPLSLLLMTPDKPTAAKAVESESAVEALTEAFGHRSYMLLVLGFFTCGFQLAFITAHLPSYLVDRGLGADVGAWTIAVIGLFNIVGSLTSGWLANRMPKRYILSFIYFTRAAAIAVFVSLPASPTATIVFGAVTGLMWLSTVPPTSGLVAVMFGSRWLAMLFGFAFFSHQVGGFLGVWLGGYVFEATKSYELVWWLAVFFGIASAVINLPISEKPVARLVTVRT